jgi:hypothetical protein
MSAWSLTSLFVLAFQCHLPQTWDIIFNECIDLRAAWNYINVANIILEFGVIALPVLVILKVKIALKRKIIVIGSFWSRIL